MTTAVLSPNGDSIPSNPTSVQKRKFSAVDEDNINGTITDHISPITAASPIETESQSDVNFNDLLVILQGHDTTPSILTFSLDTLTDNQDDGPAAKRQKVSPSNAPHTIAQKCSSSSYNNTEELIEDVRKVSQELLKPWQTQSNGSSQDEFIEPTNLPRDALHLWLGILAFKKFLTRQVGGESSNTKQEDDIPAKPETVNGFAENTPETTSEIVIKSEEETVDTFNTGQAVLTIFANTQGAPKQLFSSLQSAVKIGDGASSTPKSLDDAVEIILPLQESALPSFLSVTRVPAALENQKPKARVVTFGDKFGPPSNIPRLQPPKPSNKLVTKASHVGWVSPEALSRQRNDKTFNERVYNWCSTRLSSSSWLKYNGVDLPKEPASPEERRRQRDRALSTGAPQPLQSVESRIATEKAKDDALFRDAFSSFAPTRDNSGAVVSESIKSEIWWNRVGRQRAQRVFNDSVDQADEDPAESIDHDEEERLFKDAVENIDPELLDTTIEETKHEADKEIDDLLQDINEQIETLYSYQRIRNSTLSSSSAPMTPVGQRNVLTESVGTPSTPTTAENEVYKLLKTQLTLLILQLPPAAVSRLNGDKLDTLNISTNIVIETPNESGILEDDTPKQPAAAAHPPQIASRSTASGTYGGHPNQYTRQQGVHTPAALGPRATSYYGPGQQRTPSLSYQRQNSGPQSYAGGYPATGPRAGYSAYSQPGFSQTPTRVNSTSQYYQHAQQTAARNGYGGHSISTPQSAPRLTQTPISYARPTASAQYGQGSAQTPQSPHYPQSTQPTGTPQFNRGLASGARPSYFQGTASAASGPTGFHTSMSAQEQQSLMDRHRAQIAAQNQARLQAMGQAVANMPGNPSTYTTPSREGSGTPRPIAPNEQKTVQPNGIA